MQARAIGDISVATTSVNRPTWDEIHRQAEAIASATDKAAAKRRLIELLDARLGHEPMRQGTVGNQFRRLIRSLHPAQVPAVTD